MAMDVEAGSGDLDAEPMADAGSKDFSKAKNSKSKRASKRSRGLDRRPGLVQVYRTDLVSAMTVRPSEAAELLEGGFYEVSDQWRTEWADGVQVPSQPLESLPRPVSRVRKDICVKKPFKLPPSGKYLTYVENLSKLETTRKISGPFTYSLGHEDEEWLMRFNRERQACGLRPVSETCLESVVEEFEWQAFSHQQTVAQQELTYDENVVCDVCRTLNSEVGNQMVFCDICNVCVHQVCYGIRRVPKGSWVCRPCSLTDTKPPCELCPYRGGALKSSPSGSRWAHVICVLWIPGVRFHSPEALESIRCFSQIPEQCWNVTCCVCQSSYGACIKCSYKGCKNYYHVTCAAHAPFEMKGSSRTGKPVLRSYCAKHSSHETNVDDRPPANVADVSTIQDLETALIEDPQNASILRSEFDLDLMKASDKLKVDLNTLDWLMAFWKLKRKLNFDNPLIHYIQTEQTFNPRKEEHLKSYYEEMLLESKHARQKLEKTRFLCDMVIKREKLKRKYLSIQSEIFENASTLAATCRVSRSHSLVMHLEEAASVFSDPLYGEGKEKENTLPPSSDSDLKLSPPSASDLKLTPPSASNLKLLPPSIPDLKLVLPVSDDEDIEMKELELVQLHSSPRVVLTPTPMLMTVSPVQIKPSPPQTRSRSPIPTRRLHSERRQTMAAKGSNETSVSLKKRLPLSQKRSIVV